jgi:hypothetical protein
MTARNRAAHPLKAIATSQRLRIGPKNLSLFHAAMKKVIRPFREKMNARSRAAPSQGHMPKYAGTKDEKESDAELERKPSNHPTGTVIKGSPRWHERELKVEWHIYVPSGRSDVSESVLGSDDHAPMQTRSLSLA